jgi:hypothetical protein
METKWSAQAAWCYVRRVDRNVLRCSGVVLHPNIMEQQVKTKILFASVLFCATLISAGANAQGTVRGAAEGANEGSRAAGPVGAVVGGAIGAVTGTIGGILGVDDRPRFREYAVRERRPSYQYREDLHVGVVLPSNGVTYYDVPAEYHVGPGYRYTYVNEHPVIVEARTGRIVEILD